MTEIAMENPLILKTNIRPNADVKKSSRVLKDCPNVTRWTVDTDMDNVLRIETSGELTEKDVVKLIAPLGLHCENFT